MGQNNQFYFRPYDVSYSTAILQEKDVVQINEDAGGLSVTFDFYNNLEYPVTIGFRDGVRYVLKPRYDSSKPQRLYINRRIRMNNHTTFLHLPDISTHPEHVKLANNYHNGLLNRQDNTVNGSVKIVVEQYNIDSTEMNSQSAIYLANLDLIITTKAIDQWRHPYSPEGIFRRRLLETEYVNDELAFGLGIELVCRHASGEGYRYVNLSNNVFRIPVKFKYDRKPGLYLSYNGRTTNNQPPSPAEVKYFEWEKEDEFPIKLYDNWYDALNYGDVEEERKREIATLKHEIERLNMENKRMQAEAAKEGEYRKEVLSELEQERKERQHQMEMKSMDRKESSEFMKWLPTIIASVISLFTLAAKLNSK